MGTDSRVGAKKKVCEYEVGFPTKNGHDSRVGCKKRAMMKLHIRQKKWALNNGVCGINIGDDEVAFPNKIK